jgi:hypothetical protein
VTASFVCKVSGLHSSKHVPQWKTLNGKLRCCVHGVIYNRCAHVTEAYGFRMHEAT